MLVATAISKDMMLNPCRPWHTKGRAAKLQHFKTPVKTAFTEQLPSTNL